MYEVRWTMYDLGSERAGGAGATSVSRIPCLVFVAFNLQKEPSTFSNVLDSLYSMGDSNPHGFLH